MHELAQLILVVCAVGCTYSIASLADAFQSIASDFEQVRDAIRDIAQDFREVVDRDKPRV